LRYFARGKLWYSDEEARAALTRERFEKRERPRPTGPRPRPGQWKPRDDARKPGAGAERRGRDWRPGGAHADPRTRFKVPRDLKRRGMARKFGWKKKKDDDQ
ncbi:MAG TPA: hypothetical protein VH138_06960, partial [Vicinamibacterales bacterium]|nr:hypothetical protein [Vicinamibacterales bacterium]